MSIARLHQSEKMAARYLEHKIREMHFSCLHETVAGQIRSVLREARGTRTLLLGQRLQLGVGSTQATAKASTPTQTQPTTQRRPSHHISTHTAQTHTPSTFFLPAQIHAHFIPSDTRLAQEYLDSCFLHEASNSPTNEWAKAHTFWPSGQVRVCVQREPTSRAIIVIALLRERESRQEKERERKRDEQRVREI